MPSSVFILSTPSFLPPNPRPAPFPALPPLGVNLSRGGVGRSGSCPPRTWKCFSSPEEKPSSVQRPKKNPPRSSSSRKSEPEIDPVGFLSKFGISHRAFAQFLRDRCSVTIISTLYFSQKLFFSRYVLLRLDIRHWRTADSICILGL